VFKGSQLSEATDCELNHQLKLARDSSRVLGTQLGNPQETFTGDRMYGESLQLNKNVQSGAIKDEVIKLKDFLMTFGSRYWLGSLATGDFEKQKARVLNLLDALLEPQKCLITLPVSRGFDVHDARLLWQRDADARRLLPRSGSKTEIERMCDDLQARSLSAGDKLKVLARTSERITEMVKAEEERLANAKKNLDGKMEDLCDFANVLSEMPPVLGTYLLTRLGDIKDADLSTFKTWFPESEAHRVHDMLEAFRDAAIQEKAVRAMMARIGGSSVPRLSISSALSAASSAEAGTDD
jgi:hypothetical protein